MRAAAARGAADANAREAAPALCSACSPTPTAPCSARRCWRWAAWATRTTADTLLQHLPGAEPALRGAIATAVTRLDATRVPALLDRLIDAGDRESKLAVIRTVAQLRAPSGPSLLGVLWRDPDSAVRAPPPPRRWASWVARSRCASSAGVDDPDEIVRARRRRRARARLGGTERGAGGADVALQRDPSAAGAGTGRPRHRASCALPAGEAALLAASGEPGAPVPVRAAALLALGGYEQESMVGRLVEMADDRAVRDFLAERIKHDAEYRLLAQRLGASRHVELQALAATTREDMEPRSPTACAARSTRPNGCAW